MRKIKQSACLYLDAFANKFHKNVQNPEVCPEGIPLEQCNYRCHVQRTPSEKSECRHPKKNIFNQSPICFQYIFAA